MLSIHISAEELFLLPEKVIWWEREKALLVADLHLGKSGHFRKAGIAVPSDLDQDDLAVLLVLITRFQPTHIYMLGDLFHSSINIDWFKFTAWRKQFPLVLFHLIKGNHDVLNDQLLIDANIRVYKNYLDVKPFRLIHIPPGPDVAGSSDLYHLSGHIHPGVKLRGLARQSLCLPCFYFNKYQGILPAFGRFTGKFNLQIYPADRVFPVVSGQVIDMKTV